VGETISSQFNLFQGGVFIQTFQNHCFDGLGEEVIS
jgi:hypothetical protein